MEMVLSHEIKLTKPGSVGHVDVAEASRQHRVSDLAAVDSLGNGHEVDDRQQQGRRRRDESEPHHLGAVDPQHDVAANDKSCLKRARYSCNCGWSTDQDWSFLHGILWLRKGPAAANCSFLLLPSFSKHRVSFFSLLSLHSGEPRLLRASAGQTSLNKSLSWGQTSGEENSIMFPHSKPCRHIKTFAEWQFRSIARAAALSPTIEKWYVCSHCCSL